MNKSLYGLVIAGVLAIIGYLIWRFFFNKDGNGSLSGAALVGANVGATANNPISAQDANKVTAPIVGSSSGESAEYGSIFKKGFDLNVQESVTNGTALTQRTNNPGALFWNGVDQWQGMTSSLTFSGKIITFDNYDYGIRAQLMTLKNYYKKHGLNTLNKITARYAPLGHGGNDPVQYARILASFIGIEPDQTFNLDSNRELLAAIGYFMHRIEAGYFWVTRKKYSEWSTKV